VNLALAGVAVAAAGGCVLLQQLGLMDRPLGFSHREHIEQGFSCADCHSTYEEGDEPQPIAPAACALCHDKLDAGKPPEEQVASRFVDGIWQPLRGGPAAADLVFSHGTHLQAGLECAQCHVDVETSESTADGLLPRMGACTDCHAQLGVGNECATCHAEIRADRPPASHDLGWDLLHGRVVRSGDDATMNDCAQCHTETSCETCHADEEPQNHTSMFRLKTHGVVAGMDRDNCAACHRTDFCERCHEETTPLSHTGAFGAPLDTHCLSCHFPLASETSCLVCHKGTPSHDMAPPMPADHVPGMNCLQCHVPGAFPQHVDKGDNCLICHQ